MLAMSAKRLAVALFALTCIPSIFAGDPAVVVHPQDIERADARRGVVTVSVNQTKAKELVRKGKHVPIKLSVPTQTKGVFICETRYGLNSATISFKFPDESSAADFAEQLMAARAKALSDCDCH
jgi:hypothetical protein